MRPRSRFLFLAPLVPALAATAQYVGKVPEGNKAPPLRAVSVYEYTGSMKKPNASRLVPVVVWDGTNYQPGGLYLADPDPLAVAPGTQYVLEPDGVPSGLYNVLASSQLDGGWVGLGRYATPPPPPPPARLHASKNLPVLHGGSIGSDLNDGGGPVLHRHAGSENTSPGPTPSNTNSSSGGPTLHRRDTDAGSTSSSSSSNTDDSGPTLHKRTGADSSSATSPAPPEDPDRPHLHEGAEPPAPSADRPLLHRHEGAGARAEGAPPPDPDRPHLRYGNQNEDEALVMPTLLKAPPHSLGTASVPIGQVVAISDVTTDAPHSYAYAWPSPAEEAAAVREMHRLALHAVAQAAQASFGPAAAADAALRKASALADADAADATFGPAAAHKQAGTLAAAHPASGQATVTHGRRKKTAAPAPVAVADPLLDPDVHSFQLSYGGPVTLVYSAHTAPEGALRRYVTVIAQLDFYGKPRQLFAQTTRGDMLGQTPALHLIDAVDANGDHRAELLFDEQTTDSGDAPRDRQFALYSVVNGQAEQVYATTPGVAQ
jgi:hypothetical protein